MPIPAAIQNAPELLPGLDLFISAYTELSTCRQLGMTEGPIPWLAMNAYCDVYEIDGDLRQEFFYILRQLDNEMMEYRESKRPKPPSKP